MPSCGLRHTYIVRCWRSRLHSLGRLAQPALQLSFAYRWIRMRPYPGAEADKTASHPGPFARPRPRRQTSFCSGPRFRRTVRSSACRSAVSSGTAPATYRVRSSSAPFRARVVARGERRLGSAAFCVFHLWNGVLGRLGLRPSLPSSTSESGLWFGVLLGGPEVAGEDISLTPAGNRERSRRAPTHRAPTTSPAGSSFSGRWSHHDLHGDDRLTAAYREDLRRTDIALESHSRALDLLNLRYRARVHFEGEVPAGAMTNVARTPDVLLELRSLVLGVGASGQKVSLAT
ncbi:hypothetical protein OH76DRAFT_430394 [Lentinus brumalis]|uniref:Uncharacterized protein n=1 Tax=Lentinus brumalis TaxID=2498619 RepID=A0A371DDM4_9APHY|nr:hypothetical protein OH76DRAFT_430394 [Polyporus brumalis]